MVLVFELVNFQLLVGKRRHRRILCLRKKTQYQRPPMVKTVLVPTGCSTCPHLSHVRYG